MPRSRAVEPWTNVDARRRPNLHKHKPGNPHFGGRAGPELTMLAALALLSALCRGSLPEDNAGRELRPLSQRDRARGPRVLRGARLRGRHAPAVRRGGTANLRQRPDALAGKRVQTGRARHRRAPLPRRRQPQARDFEAGMPAAPQSRRRRRDQSHGRGVAPGGAPGGERVHLAQAARADATYHGADERLVVAKSPGVLHRAGELARACARAGVDAYVLLVVRNPFQTDASAGGKYRLPCGGECRKRFVARWICHVASGVPLGRVCARSLVEKNLSGRREYLRSETRELASSTCVPRGWNGSHLRAGRQLPRKATAAHPAGPVPDPPGRGLARRAAVPPTRRAVAGARAHRRLVLGAAAARPVAQRVLDDLRGGPRAPGGQLPAAAGILAVRAALLRAANEEFSEKAALLRRGLARTGIAEG
eukprot:CAMPEP_0119269116 /NCGR_PEP_ID=MMETSP1329-20130426/6645_1 /TAXON_ID=114041 /ORGANISM="Genus nov. species nov., Strain RCC1024" /LENGTH=421 /DNA_ID=CAMNT_0007269109 /DNA_START=12 /DNA_END=1273 /DNA_ORIENTATION=-